MLKHVLIPLDGSPLAEAAVAEARRVVSTNTKISLLIVVQPPSMAIYDYELSNVLAVSYESRLAEAITRAKSYLERLSADLRIEGFNVEALAKFGADPAQIINNIACKSQVDAIIMSTHGRSGISRWLFGSVTANVLSSASCPVFVIPSRVRERAFAEEASEINYG